ncbi:hypothetical protein QYF36_012772 [Acer negundo]|nr:hypothetical protein QYF36_012772 [Acer negundo]
MGIATVELALANLLYKFDWEMPVGMKKEDLDLDPLPVELALANLLYKFDWQMPDGMKTEELDFDVLPGLTMHKKNPLLLMANNYVI